MIQKEKGYFVLSTDNSSYIFRVLGTGHLDNVYYGKRLDDLTGIERLSTSGNLFLATIPYYDEEHQNLFPEIIRSEYPTPLKGEARESALEIEGKRGIESLTLLYDSYRIFKGKSTVFAGFYKKEWQSLFEKKEASHESRGRPYNRTGQRSKNRERNSLVRGFCGRSKISAEVPSSQMTPSAIKTTWVETSLAKAISWVTTIIVRPSAASCRITASTSPTIWGSSAEVGSSKRRASGSIASARAMATRCFIPPESCLGLALM